MANHRRSPLFMLLVVAGAWLLLAIGCVEQPPARTPRLSPNPDWIASTMRPMSLEEKVGQMFIIWTPGNYFPHDSRQWQELQRLATQRKVGGFVFSIGDVYEYSTEINSLQRSVAVPLLMSGDFEYGVAMRVKHTTVFPNAMAVGATRDPMYAYAVGRAIAAEGRALGIHQNYSPTLDINNNPRNPVINTRAFGDEPALVGGMGVALVHGLQDGGMMATAKHFPGHGDSEVDSHVGTTVLNLTKARLDTFELRPFRDAIRAGVSTVMVGHPAVTALDSAALPATVSPNVTTRLLKEEMGFGGLVISDALRMRAVAARYEPGEAAVLAVKAGIDLVLMPSDPDVAIDAVIAAVYRGEIPMSRIDASVRKILASKQQIGLDQDRFVDAERIPEIVGSREHRLLAQRVARRAVTVLGNAAGILPLQRGDCRRILDVVVCETDDQSVGNDFHGLLTDRIPRMELRRFDGGSAVCDMDSAVARAKRADLVILQLHFSMRSGEMTGFVHEEQRLLVDRLAALKKPIVAISFGNPYVAMSLPRFDSYVCAYANSDLMQEATAEVMFGEEPAMGKLPITIPERYPFGDGVGYPKVALRDGEPEEAGFDPFALKKVDSLMTKAVRDSAFPGGQLLVARNGIVAYHKVFGAFDYGRYSRRIDKRTMYDLASVTKVIATTSAVMRLVDERKVFLSDPVVKFLPAFGQAGKSHVTVQNLLAHSSGLPAWRKFFEVCATPTCVIDSVMASPLVYPTGDSTVYSDLGIIAMGKIVEKVSGFSLDRYVDSVFFKPLAMTSTMYNPPSSLLTRIAPTEVDTYWQKTGLAVRGRVHDENAAVLGGVSGHAGLFSTASDLAVILQMVLNGGTYGGRRYLSESTVRQFTTRQAEHSSRGLGWDLKASDRSFSGRLTSARTFLHTGFTGTSVVVDPEKNLIMVLLTNRVHPTRANMKIADVRPQVHDAVLEALRRQ